MSYYTFTAFFNFVMSILIGSVILFRNRKNKINITFFFFAFSVAFWSLAYCLWQISTTAESALWYCRLLMAGAIFIPVTYVHFAATFLSLNKKKFLVLSYFLFSIFLVLDFTPLFVDHVEPYLGFKFWPIPGSFFGVFLISWFLYVCYASFLLFRAMKTVVGIYKQQIRYLLFGMIFGFVGGSTNFFMWYHISIPPVLNIFVSVYVAAVAYSIVRFRSFDIKLLGAQVLVWALVIIIGSEFLFVSDTMSRFLIATTLIISGGIGLLLVRSVKKEVSLRESIEEANA